MGDYIFFPAIGHEVHCECDVTRVLSNRRQRTPMMADFQIALYHQPLGSTTWELIDRRGFGDQLALRIDAADYALQTGELAVGVTLALDSSVPDRCSSLPEPLSRRSDDALVAERAAIRFVHRGARSSYQGDYPFAMSLRPRGSLVSMGSLVMGQPDDVQTLALMVNICSLLLATKPDCFFCLHDAEGRQIVAEARFEANSVAVLEVPRAFHDPARECFFRCDQLLGVPLYITLPTAPGVSGLSVEHTHPPTEYFWPTSAIAGAGAVKSAWAGARHDAGKSAA